MSHHQTPLNQHGHVTARMETSLPMGTPSISISQQQAPKKFAPVVAPKPKFNPYKSYTYTSPPPPPSSDSPCLIPIKGPEKTLEERRSSLDAEIDSLTSILADLESSSPYKPRTPQVRPSALHPNAPVTGYKRMVIPNQPPLTATKKSTPKPQPSPVTSPIPSPAAHSVARPQQQQPVPASYTTASTPSQPTFNVQVRAAQPGPQQQPGRGPAQVQYMPAQPRGPDFAYGPPQPGFNPAPVGGYHDQHYGGAPVYGGQNTWRAEPGHHLAPAHNQPYQPPAPKKTYITDPPASLAPYGAGPGGPHKGPGQSMARPEEELDRLTKKMLYDMNHPPSEEYFG
uniref:LIM domain containing preferred translocation partner in lipoma n=1 Tax=Astyanax mexicanus TaxID=7994 RepID=A0A8B9KRT1_ASTMX